MSQTISTSIFINIVVIYDTYNINIYIYLSLNYKNKNNKFKIYYYRIGWLSNEGSPGSKIERCDLMNFEYLARKEFNGFSIRF